MGGLEFEDNVSSYEENSIFYTDIYEENVFYTDFYEENVFYIDIYEENKNDKMKKTKKSVEFPALQLRNNKDNAGNALNWIQIRLQRFYKVSKYVCTY